MRIKREVRIYGTATPVEHAAVQVHTWPGISPVASALSDEDGMAEIASQGSPGMTRVRSAFGAASYDDYSDNAMQSGQFDTENTKTRVFWTVTPGVVPTYGNAFRLSGGSGQFVLASGAVIIGGVLACFPNPTIINVTNGDRALVAVYWTDTYVVSLMEIAYADIGLSANVPLYRYTVSGGNVVTSSISYIGQNAGPHPGKGAVIGIEKLAAGTTLNASGEYSALSTTLTLGEGTWDITATVKAIGRGRDGALAIDLGEGVGPYRSLNGDVAGKITNSHVRNGVVGPATVTVNVYDRRDTTLQASTSTWQVVQTYGPTYGAYSPQITTMHIEKWSRKIFIADYSGQRIMKINHITGALEWQFGGLWSNIAVTTDERGLVYATSYDAGTGYYATHVFLSSDGSYGGSSGWGLNQVTALAAQPVGNLVYAQEFTGGRNVMIYQPTMAWYGQFGTGVGSGVQQFNEPRDVNYANTNNVVYVADTLNHRLQRFTSTGVYVSQIPIAQPRSVATHPSELSIAGQQDIYVNSQYRYIYRIKGAVVVNQTEYLFTASGTQAHAIDVDTGGDVLVVRDYAYIDRWRYVTALSDLPFQYGAAVLTAVAIPRG